MTADSIIGVVLTYLSMISGPIDIEHDTLRCMADNIYFEAANEPRIGKRQVAYTVLDRVEDANYPDTPCEVIWHQPRDYRTGEKVAHFSWTLDGKPDRIKFQKANGKLNRAAYANYVMAVEEAVFVLLEMKSRPCDSITTHYWSHVILKKPPYWAGDFDVACKIGGHTFMTVKPKEPVVVAEQ